jgi:acylphosphatase
MKEELLRRREMANEERAHVYVSGEVQGVNFRGTTQEKAEEIGLNGWVSNLQDGRVEAVFEGRSETVRQMIEWCESGPSSANVEDVSVENEQPEGLSGFEVR